MQIFLLRWSIAAVTELILIHLVRMSSLSYPQGTLAVSEIQIAFFRKKSVYKPTHKAYMGVVLCLA